MGFSDFPAIAAGALAIEALCGYPAPLFRRARHPVVWIGALIGWLDRHLNRAALPDGARRANGVLAVILLAVAAIAPALLLQGMAFGLLPGAVASAAVAVVASSLIAQRSLHAHVAVVGLALRRDGLAEARKAVSHIVGRNPESLDQAAVVRAAIESLAENFSDGVVAPAVWCALGGLPGAAFYKAINTADSMIGHRTPRHAAVGWAAARLDDLINLPASRLAAFLLVLAAATMGADARGAWRAVRRDARYHRSPNAGWPEAAMAGALGLRLAGPRRYGAVLVEDGWMGDGRAEANTDDLDRALALYRRACLIQLVAIAFLALLIARG